MDVEEAKEELRAARNEIEGAFDATSSSGWSVMEMIVRVHGRISRSLSILEDTKEDG